MTNAIKMVELLKLEYNDEHRTYIVWYKSYTKTFTERQCLPKTVVNFMLNSRNVTTTYRTGEKYGRYSGSTTTFR